MVYRIRFRRAAGTGEGEMVVEANSPTEAMVKFQHAHTDWRNRQRCGSCVTSVQAEEAYVDDLR